MKASMLTLMNQMSTMKMKMRKIRIEAEDLLQEVAIKEMTEEAVIEVMVIAREAMVIVKVVMATAKEATAIVKVAMGIKKAATVAEVVTEVIEVEAVNTKIVTTTTPTETKKIMLKVSNIQMRIPLLKKVERINRKRIRTHLTLLRLQLRMKNGQLFEYSSI